MPRQPIQTLVPSWVQQRYVLSVMLLLAVMNMYTMRVCLSVAIVEMVSHTDGDGSGAAAVVDPERCDPPGGNQTAAGDDSDASPAHPVGEFSWTPSHQGVILSSFYYGYVVSHLPGGVFADRFGGKHALGLGLLVTSVTTLLSPAAARIGSGYLIALRIIMGLGEGVTFPAISALLSEWIPPCERSRLGAFVYAGAQLGSVLGTAGGGLALHYLEWPATFYIFGALGMAWYALWLVLCYSSPAKHPFISQEERDFLTHQIKQVGEESAARSSTPWRGILTSKPVWGLVVIQVGHDWGFFTMLTDLPKYMRSVLRFDIAQNGLLSSLPYLTMWGMSMVFGALADWLIARGCLSVLNVRRLFTSVASLTCAVGIIAASFAGCDWVAVVALLTAGLGGMGGAYCGMRVNALDLSRRHAGTVMALVNGVGAISGIVSPLLIGMLTPHETMAEWRLTFWIVFGVLFVTNTVYVLLARADIQPWDRPSATELEAPCPGPPPVGGAVPGGAKIM
ncbi:Putative inorganic phosphate cotransporter [Frankliniella fusca]|uniref:Sialin n=1 Tax=Frankliniella fusca TaxID=407009 RepID=A0AAE1L8T8_9NEOP|nr:Putative inorganic phosphate cotransporter [Frankliniella fusca]